MSVAPGRIDIAHRDGLRLRFVEKSAHQAAGLDAAADEAERGASQDAFGNVRDQAKSGTRTELDVLNAEQELIIAKAGIIQLTLTAARALGRLGVCANAICPRARTAMTADVFGPGPDASEVAGGIDPLSPEHVVTLVQFLASPAAAESWECSEELRAGWVEPHRAGVPGEGIGGSARGSTPPVIAAVSPIETALSGGLGVSPSRQP